MIRVTLHRWRYNNDDLRITKDSDLMTTVFVADNCADAMRHIEMLRSMSNLAKYTNYEIVNLEDVKI